MKTINFLLAIAVSLAIGLGVLEGGLRLIGMGRPEGLNQFDAALGWSKKQDTTITRRTPDGDKVTFEFNEHGLREGADVVPEKPAGTFRVIALGDSFTLGFTVPREDLFVDQLEARWAAQGRGVQVVNVGTEAWSTDQEVAWLLEHGEDWKPDLVLIFPYDNDIFWNGETTYIDKEKPRFTADGTLEPRTLEDRWQRGVLDGSAIVYLAQQKLGPLFKKGAPVPTFKPGSKTIEREHAPLLESPPEFLAEAVARTTGSLKALRAECETLGAEVVACPIPSKGVFSAEYREWLGKERLGLAGLSWSPERPFETLLSAADDAGIRRLDVRPHLQALADETDLYFEKDWHFNAEGNRAFAEFLHDELDALGLLPDKVRDSGAVAVEGTSGGLPTWSFWFAGLWLAVGLAYCLFYRDENPLFAFLKVGALLAVIFTIAIGGVAAIGLLPPDVGQLVLILVVLVIVGFILWKLGDRLATIMELMVSFVGRGHWYLMPLVVVLLTVGSLLVVAASSPLVAPFIYTLF